MSIYGSVICIGDSLTNGARDSYWHGYPLELELILWKKYKQVWCCINKGVNGETSIDIYKRAYDVIRSYPEAAEMVLLCGTNDSKVQVETPPDRYAEHIEAMLRIAYRFQKTCYLCKIPDLRGFGAPDFCEPKLIKEYNKKLEVIAKEWKIPLIDLTGMPSENYSDGVHLTNKGYKEMAERIAKAIIKRRHYEPNTKSGMNERV